MDTSYFDNPDEYQVTTQGSVTTIIKASDNSDVTQNVDSADYCRFLNWASRHASPPFEIAENQYFFCTATADDLVEYVKEHGFVLHVNHEHAGGPHLHMVGPWLTAGDQFWRLSQSAELLSGTGQVVRDGIVPQDTVIWSSRQLIDILNTRLQNEDDAVRCLSSWKVRRSFVYIDVSDFSRFTPGQQVLVINALTSISSQGSEYWRSHLESGAFANLITRLCIGDGYIFCFRDEVSATYFAARLACKIEEYVAKRTLPVEFHFRIGVHSGDVFRFWDTGRESWNYIGDGINGGNRVLAAIGKDVDDVIFISDEVRNSLLAKDSNVPPILNILPALQNRGRKADKHGNMWRVYELNHTNVP